MNISKRIVLSAAALLVSGALVGGGFSLSTSNAATVGEDLLSKDISQVKLTYRNNPSNSIVVNWRDTAEVSSGIVQVTSKKNPKRFEDCADRNDEVCQEIKADGKSLQTQDKGTFTFFQAEVTNLKSGKEYYYRINDGKGWSPTYSFKTADGKNDFTLVAGGELHIGDKYAPGLKTMAVQIQAVNPSFMLSVGDQVDNGYREAEWERLFNTSPSLFGNVPFMPAVGNHESAGSTTRGIPSPIYFANFALPTNGADTSGRSYSFNYNGVHVAVLEANPSSTTPANLQSQVEWLKKDLKSAVSRTKFQIVITHSPLFHSKTSRVQPNYENPEFRELLVPVLDQYGVEMVISGHDKHYVRSYPINGKAAPGSVPQMGYEKVGQGQGTVYMELSTTGENYTDFLMQDWMEVGKSDVAAFLSMNVQKDKIEAKAIQADGSVLDKFTILPVSAK